MEGLDITGALGAGTLVLGQWRSVYKHVIAEGDVNSVRRAIYALQCLHGHPHIVELDGIVVDSQQRIHGYTMPYIPGGTLEHMSVFHVAWFLQLAKTVDDLNFRHNIIHGDIFPRNVIASSAGIKLIDFGWATMEPGACKDFDADCVLCTLYECMTKRRLADRSWGDYSSTKDLYARWVQDILGVDSDWSLAQGVAFDTNSIELKDLLCRWKVERRKPCYSWDTFIYSEREMAWTNGSSLKASLDSLSDHTVEGLVGLKTLA
ncbi:hypothetical protein BD410DRAFT_785262 [Rickenella mellea]|uniref:Protein kinase domain-containing protein n=1 Tax=Rickenella mellea TaxID=50990 RepID=A0A4Y7QDQ3_9AGAM|nr:hypothetical protein BD410DRAFT_785262 [Rickenella mellea]